MKKFVIAGLLCVLFCSECYAMRCSGGICRKPLRLKIIRR